MTTNTQRTAQELADDRLADCIPETARILEVGSVRKVTMTRAELHQFASNVIAAFASQAEPGVRQQTRQVQAACVAFDGRSRLRGPVRGSSERFHAIAEHGGFACDQHNLVPGEPVLAANVSHGLRCGRKACAKLFCIADASATPPAPAQAEPARGRLISSGPNAGRAVPPPPPAQAEPVALIDAARFAADVLAEIYAKHQTKIGPFASQAQKANVLLGAALRSTPPAPAQAEQSEDTALLEWMQHHGARVAWGRDAEYCAVEWSDDDGVEHRTKLFTNWRDAIRAAIAAKEHDDA